MFVEELDLELAGFEGMRPDVTGRPGYHPATLLKIYIYGYLNRIQSSRRLERETQRNVELIWLTGRLTPDFKTIADFRKDNAKAIGKSSTATKSLRNRRLDPPVRIRFHTVLYGHRPVWQADFDVMPQRGTGCSLISGLVMQAEACWP